MGPGGLVFLMVKFSNVSDFWQVILRGSEGVGGRGEKFETSKACVPMLFLIRAMLVSSEN